MIYLFDHNETLIGQLHSSHIMNATQEEVLNGIVRLDFEIAIPFIDKMEDVEFVAHKDINEPDQFHYYKITNTVNSDNTMQYTAIATFFDDMRAYGYIRENRMTATNARLAMETLLHGSRWRVGYSDVGKQADFFLYDNTRLEALSQLIDTFNVEIKFRIKINGNQISDRLVDVYNRIGYDTHKRFHYGSNALTVVREEIQDEVYTAIIGRGKGEEKFDTDGEATGGFGRRIDFKDVEWLKSQGNPLDKPKGQEYIEIPEMTLLYGYSDGTPRFGIKVHDKIEEPEELIEACYQDLIKSSRPLVQFKSSIQEMGRVFLGDTIGIIRKELNIFYKTRVFRIKRNLLNDDIAEIEFGDNLELNQAFKNKELVNNIKDLNSRVSDIAENANLAFVSVWQKLKDEFNDGFLNEDGYNYELKAGNIYGMPAGYYSFNAPIDQNPTKVIYMGAGKLMIANRKDSNGIWDFTTALDGDGVKAESIVGLLGEFAAINANQIVVGADFGESALGEAINNTSNRVTINSDGIMVYNDQTVNYTIDLEGIKTDTSTAKTNAQNALTQVGKAVIQNTLYNGVRINTSSGLTVSRSDGLVTVTVNATDGFRIDNRLDTSSAWKRAFYINTSGQAQFTGDLTILNSAGNAIGSIYASEDTHLAIQGFQRIGIVDHLQNAYLRFRRGNEAYGTALESIFASQGVGFELVHNSYSNRMFAIAPKPPYGSSNDAAMFVGFLKTNSSNYYRNAGIQYEPDEVYYIDTYGERYSFGSIITIMTMTYERATNNRDNLLYVLDELRQNHNIYINQTGLK